MNGDYFILDADGEQTGPYTFKELVDAGLEIHSRILSPTTNTWEDACDLPEFYAYFESVGIYLPTGDNLASFGWRLAAFIIDYFVAVILMNIILPVLASGGITFKMQNTEDVMHMAPSEILLLQLIISSTMIIYNALCEASSMKGSLGKKICKLVVVDVDGVGQNLLNSLLRSVGKAISIFLFFTGFISILFTEHKQAVHDMLAKTYVVKR